MCQHTYVQNHAYASESRHTYLRDVRHLSNPVIVFYICETENALSQSPEITSP